MFVPSSVLDGLRCCRPSPDEFARGRSSVRRSVRVRTLRLARIGSAVELLPTHLPSFPCHGARRSSPAVPFGSLPLPALIFFGLAFVSFESNALASRSPFFALRLRSESTFDVRASTIVIVPPLVLGISFELPRLAVDTLVSAPRIALVWALSSLYLCVVYGHFRFRKLMCPSAHVPVVLPVPCLDSAPVGLCALPSMRTPVSFFSFDFRRVRISHLLRVLCVSEFLSVLRNARFRAAHLGGHLEPTISHAVASLFPRSATRRRHLRTPDEHVNIFKGANRFCTNTPPDVLHRRARALCHKLHSSPTKSLSNHHCIGT